MQYNVISADSNLNEPPDTYTARVSARLRDRVPRVEPAEGGGERWVFDDVGCVPFGPGTAVLARGKVRGPLDYVFDLTHAEVARLRVLFGPVRLHASRSAGHPQSRHRRLPRQECSRRHRSESRRAACGGRAGHARRRHSRH